MQPCSRQPYGCTMARAVTTVVLLATLFAPLFASPITLRGHGPRNMLRTPVVSALHWAPEAEVLLKLDHLNLDAGEGTWFKVRADVYR